MAREEKGTGGLPWWLDLSKKTRKPEMPYEPEHFTYYCPAHGPVEDLVCCIPVRIQGRATYLSVTPGSIRLEPFKGFSS